MPTAKPYNPEDPTPYEAYQAPEPAPTAPPPIPTDQPQVQNLGAASGTGRIAYVADNILRGFMKGKTEATAAKAMKLKKQSDDLNSLYNSAAKRVLDMANSGVDRNSEEFKKAQSEADTAWNSYMAFIGQHVQGGEGGGKKKKGKTGNGSGTSMSASDIPGAISAGAGGGGGEGGQGRLHKLLDMFRSGDPMQVSQAWYSVAQQAGAPYKYQLSSANSPKATAGREYETTSAQSEAQIAKAKQEFQTLGLKAQRTEDEEKRYKQLQTFFQQGQPGEKVTVPRIGRPVLVGDVPPGSIGADGQPLDPKSMGKDELVYPVFQGSKVTWYPASQSQQLKKIASESGLPVEAPFKPYSGKIGEPIAQSPVRGEVKTVQTTDKQGNPVTDLIPVMPPYKKPSAEAPHAAAPAPSSSPTAEPTAGGSESHGAPAAAPSATPAAAQPVTPPGGTKAAPTTPEGERRKSARTSLTPHQEKAADVAEQTNKEAGGKGLPKGIPRYSRDVQGRYMAIRGQELTLNGIPGSKTDIGLRQATLNAMDNPDASKKVAVAMQALDQHAKSGITGHSDGDYGYIQYLKENWSTIPALQTAFQDLDSDPAGKVYLDNFFRAWTNAATIRALQGTTGRPTQSMYAMLVNELPMIGVNVSNKEDAERKLSMLQHDVDVARETLPDQLKKNVEKEFTHSVPKPVSSDEQKVVNDLIKKYGGKQ